MMLKKFAGLKTNPIIAILFVLLLFLLLNVRINTFTFSFEEESIVRNANSFKEAIATARGHLSASFVYTLTVAIHQITESKFFLRLPGILLGAASVVLFYLLLRELKVRRPFLATLIPATSFIFVYFAQEISPSIWLSGGTLFLILLSYQVFLEQKENEFWSLAALAAIFLVMPNFHFLSLFVIFALDITLIIFLVGQKKFLSLPYLLLFNLFAAIHFIPWGDVTIGFFVKNFGLPGTDFSWTKGRDEILTKLDYSTLTDVFYKFLGGGGIWGKLFLIITTALIFYGLYRTVNRLRSKSFGHLEIFTSFVFLFSSVFLGIILFLPPLWSSFLENYLVLFWPFWIIFFVALHHLFEAKKQIFSISALIILTLIILSNFANTGAYLLAPVRFADWPELIKRIEAISQETGRNRLVTNRSQQKALFEFYLKTNKAEGIVFDSVEADHQLQERIVCCQKDIIYLHLGEQKLEDPEIKRLAIQTFNRKEIIWQSPYLEFLARRGLFPYFSTTEPINYYKPIIFY